MDGRRDLKQLGCQCLNLFPRPVILIGNTKRKIDL